MLNVALFGMTAKEWRDNNRELNDKGNIRDYTDLLHLVILNNLENINAELIEIKIPQSERLVRLNSIAKKQMELLKNNKSFKNLEYEENEIKKYGYVRINYCQLDNLLLSCHKQFRWVKKESKWDIFNGQIYDAYYKIQEIFNETKKEIIIIDSYVDNTILDIVKKLIGKKTKK